jgi:hypothetical protein
MIDTDTKVRERYRRIRRKMPYFSAHDALSYARSLAALPDVQWHGGRGGNMEYAKLERDGFELRVSWSYEEGGPTFFSFTEDAPREMPNLYANPNAWLDEEDEDDYGGKHRARASSDRYGFVDPEDTYKWDVTLDAKQSTHYGGRSKQVAFEEAVREVRQWVAWVCADDYTEVIITVEAYRAGVELGSASIGGVQADHPNGIERLTDTVLLMMDEHDLIDEAIEQAEAKLRELIAIDISALKRAIAANEGKVLTPEETRRILNIIEPAKE